ncbi:hypothetical protein D3C72_2047940 [compost metagenome]
MAISIASQSNLARSGPDLDDHPIGLFTPQQVRLDRSGGHGVIDNDSIAPTRSRLRRNVVGLDHDLVVHGLYSTDTQCDLLGQVLVDVFRDVAGQGGLAVSHRDVEDIGPQMRIQRVSRPYLCFVASIGEAL